MSKVGMYFKFVIVIRCDYTLGVFVAFVDNDCVG